MSGENTNPTPPANTPPATPPPANNPPAPPANPAPANPPAESTPPAPATPLADPGTSPENPPAETPPAQPEQPKPELPDILDLAKTDEEQERAATEAEKAAESAWLKDAGIEIGKDFEFKAPDGSDVSFAARDAAAMLAAMRHSGIPADKAKDMLIATAALEKVREQHQEAEERKVLQQLREEAVQEFGPGIRAAARDMQAGGLQLFGKELWEDICTIPALVNDRRFIRAMAGLGRFQRNDTGGPAPAPATGAAGGELQFDLATFSKGMK